MAKPLVITTPRGSVRTVQTKSGTIKAKIEWNPGFGVQRTRAFNSAQEYIDNAVLRLDDPYVPYRTGMLIKSGILGTVIGSGEVQYITPYAHRQYYHTATTRGYDAQRGAYWFERMKVDHREEILNGAACIAGGKQNG
jgi:hypothetical protein